MTELLPIQSVQRQCYDPAPHLALESHDWEQVMLTVLEHNSMVLTVKPDNILTALTQLRDSPDVHESDKRQALLFLYSSPSLWEKMRSQSQAILSFTGRCQRRVSTSPDALKEVLAIVTMTGPPAPLCIRKAVETVLDDIANTKHGITFTARLNHWHTIAANTNLDADTRAQAQMCVDIMVALFAAPMSPSEALLLLTTIVPHKDCAALIRTLVPDGEMPGSQLSIDVPFYSATFAEAFRRMICFMNALPEC